MLSVRQRGCGEYQKRSMGARLRGDDVLTLVGQELS
jgi:hypothetical protein